MDSAVFAVYAVSNVIERYGLFRRGAVWAKILTPNVPVENGVVHVIDSGKEHCLFFWGVTVTW